MRTLTLEQVHALAIGTKFYDFQNSVNEILTGTPPTVECENEFILIQK